MAQRRSDYKNQTHLGHRQSWPSAGEPPMELLENIAGFLRRFFFQILACGPMPRHVSFILDGNRRYGRKCDLADGEAYRAGFLNLTRIIHYCCEIGVACISVFAFSIDNFRRSPGEITLLMDLLREKMEAIVQGVSFINDAGIQIHFVGNLTLLDAPTRDLARRAEAATAGNSRLVLIICVAYTSTDEILRGARAVCEDEWARARGGAGAGAAAGPAAGEGVTVAEIERRMGFAGHPEPDILMRTSGETRLSNFLLWQTGGCLLDAPTSLWPELSVCHLLSAIIRFQRHYWYLQMARIKIQNYGLYYPVYANVF